MPEPYNGLFYCVYPICSVLPLPFSHSFSGPQGPSQAGGGAACVKEATGEAEQAPHGLPEHVLPAPATDTVRVCTYACMCLM